MGELTRAQKRFIKTLEAEQAHLDWIVDLAREGDIETTVPYLHSLSIRFIELKEKAESMGGES